MSSAAFGGKPTWGKEECLTSYRRLFAVGIAAALALVGTGSAIAASPQRIYQDLADNGRLDGKYSRADLARALNPRQVLRTDERTPASRQRNLERTEAGANQATPAPPSAKAKRRDGLPFSGLDVALLFAGGGPLLLLGIGLRRRLQPRTSEAPAASA